MEWRTLLTYITGTVDQELLVRNEYLVAGHRVLRNQIPGRVRLTGGDGTMLAELGKWLGKQALAEVSRWSNLRPLRPGIGSSSRDSLMGPQRPNIGRLQINPTIEQLIVQFAKENQAWGDDRLVGVLKNVGYTVSDQTVGNSLKRHNLPPGPQSEKRPQHGASLFALTGTS